MLVVEWAPRSRSFHNAGRAIFLHNSLISGRPVSPNRQTLLTTIHPLEKSSSSTTFSSPELVQPVENKKECRRSSLTRIRPDKMSLLVVAVENMELQALSSRYLLECIEELFHLALLPDR